MNDKAGALVDAMLTALLNSAERLTATNEKWFIDNATREGLDNWLQAEIVAWLHENAERLRSDLRKNLEEQYSQLVEKTMHRILDQASKEVGNEFLRKLRS